MMICNKVQRICPQFAGFRWLIIGIFGSLLLLFACACLAAKKLPTGHHQRIIISPSKKFDGKVRLLTPNLEELAETLQSSLEENFEHVNVSVVDCPDLTKAPFNLLSPGLRGSQRIADVGGIGNFYPIMRKTVYKLDEICQTVELDDCFIIGAGGGPLHLLGFNSDVLKVKASRRTGEENFVTQMRKGLVKKYGSQPIGLGGIFLIKQGKIKMQIMPEFLPPENFTDKEAFDKWFTYFDMDAPLTSTSVFVSVDPDLNIRLEHSHCFSENGNGGHYRYDISPEEVQYEGYFTPAEHLYRIDRVA